jgi:hypothetical protein
VIKSELQELVQLVYALYNQALYKADEKQIFQAWWALLQDLDQAATKSKILELSTIAKYMPKPGDIRVAVKKDEIPNLPPGNHEFWAYLQDVRNNRNAGIHENTRKEVAEHPCVQKTIAKAGATVCFGLSTNGDRQWILEAYTEIRDEFMVKALTVVESNA